MLSETEWLYDEIERKREIISQMRALIAQLYAERGEYKRVAELCLKAMQIADEG